MANCDAAGKTTGDLGCHSRCYCHPSYLVYLQAMVAKLCQPYIIFLVDCIAGWYDHTVECLNYHCRNDPQGFFAKSGGNLKIRMMKSTFKLFMVLVTVTVACLGWITGQYRDRDFMILILVLAFLPRGLAGILESVWNRIKRSRNA